MLESLRLYVQAEKKPLAQTEAFKLSNRKGETEQYKFYSVFK